jgi:hypothetical protein
MSLPGCLSGDFGLGVGGGFCTIGGSLGGGGLTTGRSGMIGRPFCMVLSGQSRLAEVHF